MKFPQTFRRFLRALFRRPKTKNDKPAPPTPLLPLPPPVLEPVPLSENVEVLDPPVEGVNHEPASTIQSPGDEAEAAQEVLPSCPSSHEKPDTSCFKQDDSDLSAKEKVVFLECCRHCSHGNTISGMINVANIAYKKVVSVRVTNNQWRTYEDVPAEHFYTDTNLERDHFRFTLPFDSAVEFAIFYMVEGRVFWDSNNGENYVVQ